MIFVNFTKRLPLLGKKFSVTANSGSARWAALSESAALVPACFRSSPERRLVHAANDFLLEISRSVALGTPLGRRAAKIPEMIRLRQPLVQSGGLKRSGVPRLNGRQVRSRKCRRHAFDGAGGRG